MGGVQRNSRTVGGYHHDHRSGIGDRIIAIDAEPINNPMQLFAAVVTRRPNTAVTIDFVRNDTQQQVEATLAGIDL